MLWSDAVRSVQAIRLPEGQPDVHEDIADVFEKIAELLPKKHHGLVWRAYQEYDHAMMVARTAAAKQQAAEQACKILRDGATGTARAYEVRLLEANSKLLEVSQRMSMPGMIDHLELWIQEAFPGKVYLSPAGLWCDLFTDTGEGMSAFQMIKGKTSIQTEAGAADTMASIKEKLKEAVKASSLQAFNNGRAGIAIFPDPLTAEECNLLECICTVFCFPYQRF